MLTVLQMYKKHITKKISSHLEAQALFSVSCQNILMQTKCSTLLNTKIVYTTVSSKRTLIYTWERRTVGVVADACLQKAGNFFDKCLSRVTGSFREVQVIWSADQPSATIKFCSSYAPKHHLDYEERRGGGLRINFEHLGNLNACPNLYTR